MLTTVPVHFIAYDQNGQPVAGAILRAKLDQTEIQGGFVVPEIVEVVADAAGEGVLDLWPNALGVAGSMYRVTATNPDTGRKFLDATASVPNSACELHQILVQEPYPAVDAAAQALIAAQGALAAVTAQAQIATTKAGEALGSASSASGSAIAAASSASAASGSAGAASGSAYDASQAAGAAAIYAGQAQSSADAAAGSSSAASASAGTATTKAGEASSSASTATTKAGEASTSASNAATSESNAAASAAVYGDVQIAFAAMASDLIATQAIVATHHAFT